MLGRGDSTIKGNVAVPVAFKNCAMFTRCITKTDGTTIIDDAENLFGYSSTYSDTTENFLFYSKDEAANFGNDNQNTNAFKSFKYKTKLIESTANGILEDSAIAVSLKYPSNFLRSLEIPLINCKFEKKLRWTN